jgi:hypothetical protein
MTRAKPHDHLWEPIAQLLAALRILLRTTAPEAFAQIALSARAQLIALTALVRRYIHVLAAGITLPPPRARDPQADHRVPNAGPRPAPRYRFPLIESPSRPGAPGTADDPADFQWALLMQAAARLAAVMANPAPHALRLARRLRTLTTPALRDLPVRWSALRRLGPYVDTLLMRLDEAARPAAWAAIDTS